MKNKGRGVTKALVWEAAKPSPIYSLENGINGDSKFAVSRLTDHGKYIRGGQLYYNLNGVDIYTDINNTMFIDLDSNSIFVRDNKGIEKQIGESKDDPEKRSYILLLRPYSYEVHDQYSWESIIGRTDTYEWIKTNIEIYGFDPKTSLVLTPNVALKDAYNIVQFIQHLQNADLVEDKDFDITEYIVSL